MTKLESISFNNRVEELNRIIQNDILLGNEYEKYINEEARYVVNIFEPYYNRYLMALRNRGLLPSLLGRKKKLQILNMIRCEAHRDKVLKSFDKNLNT